MNKLKPILTKTEYKIITLLLKGYSYPEIDTILGIDRKYRAVIVFNLKNKLKEYGFINNL